MKRRSVVMASVYAGLAAPLSTPLRAQPVALGQTLRIVVGYPAGGASDRAARLVAERLQDKLKTPVIVENRLGAGGRTAAQQLVNTPPHQTVMMLANPAVMVVAPLVVDKVGYNPARDFVPLSFISEYEFGVAVGSALPVKQLSHMLAWMASNPEKANMGVPATGSLPHFFSLMLSYQTAAKTEIIGYRGSSPMINDLVGGQIPIAIDTIDSLAQQHEAGKIRVLATSGSRRSAWLSNVPTFKEAGAPIAATGWNVMYTPATTPKAVQDVLAKALFEVMSEAATQSHFKTQKMDPVAMNQAQTIAALEAFSKQWVPVIKRSGFKASA